MNKCPLLENCTLTTHTIANNQLIFFRSGQPKRLNYFYTKESSFYHIIAFPQLENWAFTI